MTWKPSKPSWHTGSSPSDVCDNCTWVLALHRMLDGACPNMDFKDYRNYLETRWSCEKGKQSELVFATVQHCHPGSWQVMPESSKCEGETTVVVNYSRDMYIAACAKHLQAYLTAGTPTGKPWWVRYE